MDCRENYFYIRKNTELICEPLELEDYVVQPDSFVSPVKWHLAHTSWFFEEMILKKYLSNYQEFNSKFSFLFNSYYKTVGKHFLQSQRGTLSRPTVDEVYQYRSYIDKNMKKLFEHNLTSDYISTLEIGLNHEQQHQELLMMDIKYILASNPCLPIYFKDEELKVEEPASDHQWAKLSGGLEVFGADDTSFHYDNESPKHQVFLNDYLIRDELVSNREFLDFINDNSYSNPRLWLSQGYSWIESEQIKSPLYWYKDGEQWYEYTLYGPSLLKLNAPVTHISYHEAYAFAKWKGCRLPTEYELEKYFRESNYTDSDDYLHPMKLSSKTFQGWNWSSSQYGPYPGFTELEGSLGEYNGKFMCNQFVLKGGCINTPKGHTRYSYRNFYEPHQRWMFSTIRLAKDKV